MNQDEIVAMAREAGAYVYTNAMVPDSLPEISFVPVSLERFANLVAAHEQEACAQLRARMEQLQTERDELLGHLRDICSYCRETGNTWLCFYEAEAAIAKMEVRS